MTVVCFDARWEDEMWGSGVCRVCLVSETSLRPIFSSRPAFGLNDFLHVSCADMMLACAAVTVTEDDNLPRQICVDCLTNLKIAYQFKKKCESSYELLMNALKSDNPNDHISSNSKRIKEENIELQYEDNKLMDADENAQIKNEDYKEESEPISNIADVGVEPEIEIKEGTDMTNSERLRLYQSEKNKSNRPNVKVRIDTKKYGYFIIAEQDDVGLEPDYLDALYRIYKHRCNHCPRIYAVASYFRVHVNGHLGIRPYYCETCKKNFPDERSHVKYHRQRKEKGSYRCQLCERAYNCEGSLRTHMKIHTGEIKWFPCSQCPKKFNQLNKLNNHMVVHTNDRNFICQYCSKAFRFDRNLKAHITSIHVKIRSHMCDSCPKGFTTTHELTLHKRRHLGIKNHHCQMCSLSFVSSSEVQSHMLSAHTKNKNYACRNCGARFSRSTHRNNHEQSKRCVANMAKGTSDMIDSDLAEAVEAGRFPDDFTPRRGRQKKSLQDSSSIEGV